jgi:hypothetical protein
MLSRLLPGFAILCAGGLVGVLLLMEKNGNHTILGTGTSLTTAVIVGMTLMMPGAALILSGLPAMRDANPHRPARPGFVTPLCWALILLSAVTVGYLVYFSFGMTLNLRIPKSAISWDISRPMNDFFHEGEIIGSIGFFTSGSTRDFPMLIHGPGRNLLPAWIVSHFGGAGTMVAEMRFITSAGNFLGMLLATACAMTATLIIVRRQKLIVPGRTETLAYSALGVLLAMTIVALIGSVTNREVVFFSVVLISILLIWSTSSGRARLASGLAVALGALTMLSPLHTYLGGVQSTMVALAAAGIALVVSPGKRLALFVRGVLGAVVAFVMVSVLGGYWLIHDAVVATLYWSENAAPLWERYAPRFVLVGSLVLMVAGAILGGFSLAGKAVGMEDSAVRGVLALLVVILMVATFSYANLSDLNHFGFGLYIASPAIAAVATLVFLTVSKAQTMVAFVLAIVFAVPASISIFAKDGSGIIRSVRLLDTPDQEILPETFFTFTTRFREELAAQDCLLVMSNDGALAYLPRLPLCGTIFNPIHLNAEGDLALATWLENNPQKLVVDGADGYGAVGGPPMRSRLPLTYAVIDRLYPRTERLGPWEIRLP